MSSGAGSARGILYLFWNEFQGALEEELRSSGAKPTTHPFGFEIALAEGEAPPQAAFARQVLADPIILNNESIRQIAEKLHEIVPDNLTEWQFHSFTTLERGGERRAELVAEAVREILKKRRGRTLKALKREGREGGLLQHVVTGAEQSVISFVSAERRAELGDLVCPFAEGRVAIDPDPRPPARAYLKLVEAMKLFGVEIQPQETVADLGCTPGSWAWIALNLGATVTGVDRSAPEPSVMHHPRFEFKSGDAFKFVPAGPVDWLLCDVIAEPARTLSLLEEWLSAGRMRSFCVTMKFKGEKRGAEIQKMRALLRERSSRWILRHLENNGNEVTAIGSAIAERKP